MTNVNECLSISLREIVEDCGEDAVLEVVHHLAHHPSMLNEVEHHHKDTESMHAMACIDISNALLENMPTGLGIDNYYVASYPTRPNYNLIMFGLR